MKGISRFRILKEDQMIFIVYSGEIKMDIIKHTTDTLAQDPDFSPFYNILTDLSTCSLNIELNELSEYIEFAAERLRTDIVRRSALLAGTPNETALSMLYTLDCHDDVDHQRVFSTADAAFKYLKNDASSAGSLQVKLTEFRTAVIEEFKSASAPGYCSV